MRKHCQVKFCTKEFKIGLRSGKWGADWRIGVKVCLRPSADLVRRRVISGRHSKALWQSWQRHLRRSETAVVKSKRFTFVVIHLIPRERAPSFCTSYRWPMAWIHLHDAFNSFKARGIHYLLMTTIRVWQDVQHCCPESLIYFWCFGGQGSKGKEED